jgi:hypothetical protein
MSTVFLDFPLYESGAAPCYHTGLSLIDALEMGEATL